MQSIERPKSGECQKKKLPYSKKKLIVKQILNIEKKKT